MFGAELEMTMNSKQRRKATRHMELERAALLTGMCRMATKANEAAQALGKFGNAMKAAKPPKMNFVFLSGEANPLKLDASERRFMVVLDDVEPPNAEVKGAPLAERPL